MVTPIGPTPACRDLIILTQSHIEWVLSHSEPTLPEPIV